MSSGHRYDEPAPISAVLRMLGRHPGLAAHVAKLSGYSMDVNRGYRIPYLAGSSIDGCTVYVDSETPKILERSKIEPDRFYAAHEAFEWYLMTRLGMCYAKDDRVLAHRYALGFEHMQLRLAGHSLDQIEDYEQDSEELLTPEEMTGFEPAAFPPDLYLGPYEEEPTEEDLKLLPLLYAARTVQRNDHPPALTYAT